MSNYYEDHYGTAFTVGTQSWHSFRDFGLYPHEHPDIPPAEIKTKTVDVPGASGVIDLTEILAGYPTFKNRRGTFTFLCADRRMWDAALTRLSTCLHGKDAWIVKDEEPEYMYHGRVSVDRLECDEARGIITVTADMEPYKYERSRTSDRVLRDGEYISLWKWDPFSFVNGVIRDYHGIEVSGSKTVTVVSSPVGGTPAFLASALPMTVTYDGTTYTFTSSGIWVSFDDIELPHEEKEVTFTFTGTGTVRINFLPGYL